MFEQTLSPVDQDTSRHTMGFQPARPTTIEDTGLSRAVLSDLVLKRLYVEGQTTLSRLGRDVKLDYLIVESMFRAMQKDQLCETRGMSGEDFEIALTSRGLRMAEEAYRRNQYSGPAPVPLKDYTAGVRAQVLKPHVNHDTVTDSLADLIVSEEMISDLGTALVSGGTIFLYGPTGNGKTSIAERLHRLFYDSVYIPYAVEVSGYILNVYDPIIHKPFPDSHLETVDPRWIRAERPTVRVGGELHAEMLEPMLDQVTRLYRAPLQMKANNGMLIIDDFGRQRMAPRDLLNRWIVPLDRHVDQLSLVSGVSFEVPFELLVIIATNLDPKDLAEDAFMRRMRNKVKVDSVTPEILHQIFRRVCVESNVDCSQEVEDYLVSECSRHASGGMLRACFASDLVRILSSVAAFEQRQLRMTVKDVDRAINLYFAH